MPRVVNGIEELRMLLGQELGVSDWLPVSQDLIDRYADISGDHQWIHVDVERATRGTPFKSTIAHGFLTVTLLTRLVRDAVEVRGDFKMTINYGFNRLRFVSPVPAGSRIRARVAPQGIKDVEGGVEVTWQVTIEVEGGTKPAVAAEWLGRYYY